MSNLAQQSLVSGPRPHLVEAGKVFEDRYGPLADLDDQARIRKVSPEACDTGGSVDNVADMLATGNKDSSRGGDFEHSLDPLGGLVTGSHQGHSGSAIGH